MPQKPHSEKLKMIENKINYPFVTKLLIDLFNEGELPNVKEVLVEPNYGYVGRIKYHNGDVHIFRSTNLGINSLGASEISKDKGYTKFFLNQLGYNTPKGEIFLMPDYLGRINSNLQRNNFKGKLKSAEQSFEYAERTLGYPCYIKPNFGSQGRGITKCRTPKNLEKAIKEFQETEQKMFLLEEAIDMPDFRVVVFRDEVISCYQRIPLQVIGNGKSTIENLLREKQELYFRLGRKEVINLKDQDISAHLEKYNLDTQSVLACGRKFQLLDVSNLSKGGESKEFTNRIHEHWKRLAINITKDMGLDLCGVDIACKDIESSKSEYSIFEINASPGLDNYASGGDEQFIRVKELYRRIFDGLKKK